MWWALGGALLLLTPFLLHNGIPAYIHDWSWPPDQAGLRAMTARAASAWVPDGLGGPNVFPSALPQFYLEWLLAWVVPSRAVLDLLLIVSFAAGIAGGAFAARTLLGVSPRWALACGFFYMAGPVAIAKFVAGHTSYLEAYAVLPFVLGLFLTREVEKRRLWVLFSALALALSIVQLQMFGLALLILLLAVLFRRRTLAEAGLIGVLALPIVLPALLGAIAVARSSEGAISMQRAVLSWQLQQSVPPLEAFEGRGYFARYYELSTQFWLQHALLLFPLCAVFALFELRRHVRIALLLVLLAAIAWLTATGLRGPLHDLWSALFTRVAAFSVYRELYDVMALYWLACVLLAARFWMQHRAVGWLFVLFGLWATVPGWFAAPNLFGWAPSAAAIEALDRAARNLPPGRIVWWPAQQPLGPSDRQIGGADPLAYTPLGQSRSLFEYQPFGTFAAAVTLAQNGAWPAAERIFQQLGVVAIAERTGFASFVSGATQLARPVPATAAMHVVAAADGMRLVSLSNALPIVALQESAAFTEVPRAFVHSVTDTMPAHGRLVAAYPYYYVTPAIGLCGPASVLGYADDLLARRRPWYFVGPYTARGSCTWITQTALAGLPKNDLLVAGGWSEYPLAPSSQAQSVSSGTVVITSQTNDAIEGELRTATGGVLVFRNEFDPRWTLNIGGAKLPARLVEGFANGWNVPPGARHFAVRFSPSGYVRITIAAGLIWFVLLLSELVRILRNERGHTAAH